MIARGKGKIRAPRRVSASVPHSETLNCSAMPLDFKQF